MKNALQQAVQTASQPQGLKPQPVEPPRVQILEALNTKTQKYLYPFNPKHETLLLSRSHKPISSRYAGEAKKC